MDLYYSVEQISDLLDIHPKTIQRYIREGKLHAVKIGKSWRVTGHDLSLFTEGTVPKHETSDGSKVPKSVQCSCVADIGVSNRDSAIRIMNTLTAVLNAKPPEYGHTSMQAQHIELEQKVRVTLWGGPKFMAVMCQSIADLTETND